MYITYYADGPLSAKCFGEEDRIMLMVGRVRHDETGIKNKQYKQYRIIEALTDPFVWCCVALSIVANFGH